MVIDLYTCFIVHTDPTQRLAIRLMAEAHEPFLWLGEAADAQTAVCLCHMQPPAVVIWEATAAPLLIPQLTQFHDQCPTSKILLWGNPISEIYLAQLLTIGVAGYLAADASPSLILSSLRTIAHDGLCFSKVLIGEWLVEQQLGGQAQWQLLTDSERQLLPLLGNDQSYKEIATELGLSPQTVRNYLSKLYAKLGVASRPEAVMWYSQMLLLDEMGIGH